MFDTVLDAFAEVTGCDRSALAALVGDMPDSARSSAAQLPTRIAAQELLGQAVQATHARDRGHAARSGGLSRPPRFPLLGCRE